MASGTERRARRSRAQWRTLIERGERSALGIGAFCCAEGMSTASFYNWRKRLRESAPSDGSAAAGAPAPAFPDLGAPGCNR